MDLLDNFFNPYPEDRPPVQEMLQMISQHPAMVRSKHVALQQVTRPDIKHYPVLISRSDRQQTAAHMAHVRPHARSCSKGQPCWGVEYIKSQGLSQ